MLYTVIDCLISFGSYQRFSFLFWELYVQVWFLWLFSKKFVYRIRLLGWVLLEFKDRVKHLKVPQMNDLFHFFGRCGMLYKTGVNIFLILLIGFNGLVAVWLRQIKTPGLSKIIVLIFLVCVLCLKKLCYLLQFFFYF